MRKFLFLLPFISMHSNTGLAQDLESTPINILSQDLVMPTFLMNGLYDLDSVITVNAKPFHDYLEAAQPMLTGFYIYHTYPLTGKDQRLVKQLVKDFCKTGNVPFDQVVIVDEKKPYTIPKTPIVNKETVVSEEYIESLTSPESKATAKEYSLVVKVMYTWMDF